MILQNEVNNNGIVGSFEPGETGVSTVIILIKNFNTAAWYFICKIRIHTIRLRWFRGPYINQAKPETLIKKELIIIKATHLAYFVQNLISFCKIRQMAVQAK